MCIFGQTRTVSAPPPAPLAPPPPPPVPPKAPIPEPAPVTTEVNPKVKRDKETVAKSQYAKGTGQLRIPKTKGLNTPAGGGPAGGLNNPTP